MGILFSFSKLYSAIGCCIAGGSLYLVNFLISSELPKPISAPKKLSIETSTKEETKQKENKVQETIKEEKVKPKKENGEQKKNSETKKSRNPKVQVSGKYPNIKVAVGTRRNSWGSFGNAMYDGLKIFSGFGI